MMPTTRRPSDWRSSFLEQVGTDQFVLTVSFDEPHGPFVCPPEYWEKFADSELPIPDIPTASRKTREK